MDTKNWPTEAGLYFARRPMDPRLAPAIRERFEQRFPLIVDIRGEAPFLRIAAIYDRDQIQLRANPVPGSGLPDDIIFGARIPMLGDTPLPRDIEINGEEVDQLATTIANGPLHAGYWSEYNKATFDVAAFKRQVRKDIVSFLTTSVTH